MKIKFKYKAGLLLFIFALMAMPASAVLEVTFSESLQVNRIQYYWDGDADSAKDVGQKINSDKTISFDLTNDNLRAKPANDPPTNMYVFGADEQHAGSQNISIRVWSAQAQSSNAQYTALATYGNPTGALNPVDFNIAYQFIRANPTTAKITQYTESGTVVIAPPSTTSKVTFASASDKVNNMTVEIAQSKWELVQDATKVEITTGGTNLTLDTQSPPSGFTLNPGDSITLRVKHINLWGAESSSWSQPLTYVVGAGVAVGGPETITYNLHREVGGLGINSFSFPFAIVTSPGPIANVKQFIETINNQAGKNIVTTYGWYDKDKQVIGGYVVNYKSATVNDFESFTSVGDAPAVPENKAMVKDGTYQVSVLEDAQVTLTGTR